MQNIMMLYDFVVKKKFPCRTEALASQCGEHL